jgi:hypothetical protein
MRKRLERRVQEVLQTVPSEELDQFRRDWAKRIYRQATAAGIPPADADKLYRRVFNGEPKHKAADALGITAKDLNPLLTEAALRDDFGWDPCGRSDRLLKAINVVIDTPLAERECRGCTTKFAPTNPRQRYHNPKRRSRARRLNV